MATPKTVGTATGVASGLCLQPEIEWSIEDKVRCTLTYSGPYAAGVAATLGSAATYRRGQTATLDGIPGMTLERIGLKRRPGDRCIVTLTYSAPQVDDPQDYSEEEPRPQCEWNELQRPIESHPRYTMGRDLTGAVIEGLVPIEQEGFLFIKEYFSADAERQKEMYDSSITAGRQGEIDDFSSPELMKELIGKKLRGQDTFVLYSPVVSMVSIVNGIPTSSNCGLRVTPPANAHAPSNYVYLQTADRTLPGASGGRYTRTLEYTGADSVDEDIYPAAPQQG